MDTEFENNKEKIRKQLADFLGVEAEDIDDESILSEDLHMNSANLTDFTESLVDEGYDTSRIDLTEIETFLDLVDSLTAHV